jgi:hypothetical protein
MRLINVRTEKLEEFFGENIPPYAILSHCWDREEVSIQDYNKRFRGKKLGDIKIDHACHQAEKDDVTYVWVDTCCIDKSSSAELSEAINSMYQWYANARVCYAYLEDVNELLLSSNGARQFTESKWFTRGWTLQELVAPYAVEFFGLRWTHLGSKRDLSEILSKITKVPQRVLLSPQEMKLQSVARRMSWASERQTTRIEDTAYCLLGIFGINMPLLYGEGDRAFQRLQEELIKESDDQTIFGWQDVDSNDYWGIFARSPADFRMSGELVSIPKIAEKEILPYTMTNMGLYIRLPVLSTETNGVYVGILDCHTALDFSGNVGIPLVQITYPSLFMRITRSKPRPYKHSVVANAKLQTIYIMKNTTEELVDPIQHICRVNLDITEAHGYKLTAVAPSEYTFNWDTSTMGILVDRIAEFKEGQHKLEAAFEFSSKTGRFPTNLVVVFTILATRPDEDDSSATASIFHKPTSIPLKQWFELFKSGRSTQYSAEADILSTRVGLLVGPKVKVNVNVTQETIFNQNIFIINLTC